MATNGDVPMNGDGPYNDASAADSVQDPLPETLLDAVQAYSVCKRSTSTAGVS